MVRRVASLNKYQEWMRFKLRRSKRSDGLLEAFFKQHERMKVSNSHGLGMKREGVS
jgi:hypothetical protein